MSSTILIVDDDPVQRRLLQSLVTKTGHRCEQAEDGQEGLDVLTAGGSAIDLVILDLLMPGVDGMAFLKSLRERCCTIPVIVQTAKGSIETVVEAMRAGAVDFVVKPASPERLKVSISNALKMGAMEEVVRKVARSSANAFSFDDMIASAPSMQKVLQLGKRAAASSIPVLIEGESGVGKEVLAKAIQGSGARKGKPFVTVNCGALPENLAESILFGHEKGAFTGATQSHLGKFKEADGGTLFLDEIGELSTDIQVKLLRAIQEGVVDPVGANRSIKTDFRLITATNRDLVREVEEGRFREDLFYRINVFPVTVPPLRQRKGDIAALVRHFTARICLEEGRRNISGIRNDALAMLEAHDWPGNIRQLENALFRAVILCDGDELTPAEFPQFSGARTQADGVESASWAERLETSSGSMALVAPAIDGGIDSDEGAAPFIHLTDEQARMRPMQAIERDAIAFAIEHHKGRMTRVARSLGIGRSTLYRRLKELGLDAGQEAEKASPGT